MAGWLTEFHLIPRQAATARTIDARALRETSWWSAARVGGDVAERISHFLPGGGAGGSAAGASGGDALARWGSAEGDHIDLHRGADGKVSSIVARVDVRKPDPKFAAGLLALVRTVGAVLVRADGFVVEPTVGGFSAALRSSVAWRAVHGAPHPPPDEEP